MPQLNQNAKKNTACTVCDSELFSTHSAKVEAEHVTSEDLMLKKSSIYRDAQHMLAAGGLSAGVASQLISSITTTSPIAGGIAHTFLSVACIMGLATLLIHASFPVCATSIKASNFLGYLSLWFVTIGIVILAWAIQPEPVAIAVTIFSCIVVLVMVVRLVSLLARIHHAEQNV